MPASTTVPAVERAIEILEALDSSARGLTISQLSLKLGIPRSTAHILIATLERAGYVVRQPGQKTYQLGMRVYHLGREMLRNLDLPQVALEPMQWLSANARLTCHLAVIENGQAVYVQKVEGPGFIRFDTRIGKRTNLHCTAVGKVLLAFGSATQRKRFLDNTTFARYTRKTIVTAQDLKAELDRVKLRGYALDDEEEELEVRCIAVPVYSPTGDLLAALSATGTLGQLCDSALPRMVQLLQRAAARICNHTGARAAEDLPDTPEGIDDKDATD